MATRVNRAATASNKKGGRSRKRNRSVFSYNVNKRLENIDNQKVFRKQSHETKARLHNASAGIAIEERATPSMAFKLTSEAITDGRALESTYTADGANKSPPLNWSKNTAAVEYVLIFEDITDPKNSLVHWLVYGIPVSVTRISEGVPAEERISNLPGTIQGKNSFGRIGYSGPFPPLFDGWHHYRFRLLALSASLGDLKPGLTKEELFKKIRGRIIEEAEQVTRYKRGKARAA